MWNPDRISTRRPCGYDEVVKTPGDDEVDTEEGSRVTGKVPESGLWSEVGFCFCRVGIAGCRILYVGFPFVDAAVGAGAGIGTGVAVLDVSVESDKEDGRLIVDMESESNGFLAFPPN